jgi:hypothetical protein
MARLGARSGPSSTMEENGRNGSLLVGAFGSDLPDDFDFMCYEAYQGGHTICNAVNPANVDQVFGRNLAQA